MSMCYCPLHQNKYEEEWELFRACEGGDVEAVKQFAGRVNMAALSPIHKWTPLHSAAMCVRINVYCSCPFLSHISVLLVCHTHAFPVFDVLDV